MKREDPKSLLAEIAAREARAGSASGDRRQFVRHTVRGESSLRRVAECGADEEATATLANVRDASRGGLGIVSKDRLEVGGIYRVLCTQDSVEAFSTQVVVRHVQPIDGGMHMMGAMFLGEGAWLMSLGVAPADLRSGELSAGDGADGEFSGVAA